MKRIIAAALVLATTAAAATAAPETVRKDRNKAEVGACLVSFGFLENSDWINIRVVDDKWNVDSRPGLKAKPSATPPVAGNPEWAKATDLCLHGKPL